MKLVEIFKAREPLKRLTEKRFNSYKALRQLVKLQKAVESEVEFYIGEERKAIARFAAMDEKGNPIFLSDGRLQLKDAEAKVAFENEIGKLNDTEVEDIEKVTLCESDFISPGDYPTPSDMVLLESVITFED